MIPSNPPRRRLSKPILILLILAGAYAVLIASCLAAGLGLRLLAGQTPGPISFEGSLLPTITPSAMRSTAQALDFPCSGQTKPGTVQPSLPAPTDQIQASIQDSMNLYAQAYNENKFDLLTQAVDQTNPPFRRLVKSRFEDFQASIAGGRSYVHYTVARIDPLPGNFVVATLYVRYSNLVSCWPFRQVEGRWVLSEPTVAQVGEPAVSKEEHFTFQTYPWADNINGQISALMDRAAQRVQAKLGTLPDRRTDVKILPIYGLEPFSSPNAVAQFVPGNSANADTIKIYSPFSYMFGYFNRDLGWQTSLEDTLTHEYTHAVQSRSFDGAGKMMDWFGEGLAEYVSDSTRILEVREAIVQERLIPIIDPAKSIGQQDLMHLYLLDKDLSLAYAESQSLITYIAETYGGMDAVWKLARSQDEIQDFDKALQQSFGVSYTQFDQDWRAWLKKNF